MGCICLSSVSCYRNMWQLNTNAALMHNESANSCSGLSHKAQSKSHLPVASFWNIRTDVYFHFKAKLIFNAASDMPDNLNHQDKTTHILGLCLTEKAEWLIESGQATQEDQHGLQGSGLRDECKGRGTLTNRDKFQTAGGLQHLTGDKRQNNYPCTFVSTCIISIIYSLWSKLYLYVIMSIVYVYSNRRIYSGFGTEQ